MTGTPPPRQETWNGPPPGGAWRARLFFPLAFIWCFAYLGFLAVVVGIFPRSSRKWRTPLIRGWGKSMLFMFGVKLEVHGLQYHDAPGAKILLANHVSLIDLFIYSAQWSDPGSVMYKKEFSKIPVFGFSENYGSTMSKSGTTMFASTPKRALSVRLELPLLRARGLDV